MRNDRFGANNRSLIGRGCVKTKTDLAVNQFCKIQTSTSRTFELRVGFFARFAQFAKVPRVLTQPRPSVARRRQFPVSPFPSLMSGRYAVPKSTLSHFEAGDDTTLRGPVSHQL